MDAATILLLVVIFFVSILWKPLWNLSVWWKRIRFLRSQIPQGGHAHWLKGHAAEDPKDDFTYAVRLAQEMPRMSLRRIGFMTTVSLSHPDVIAQFMRHGPDKHMLIYSFFKFFLGNGLGVSVGKRWARDRRLLTHVFTQDMLKAYVPVYKDACNTMLGLWSERMDQTINVSDYLPNLTFDVIMRCAMGMKSNCQVATDDTDLGLQYQRSIDRVFQLSMERLFKPWLYNDWIFEMSASGREGRKLLDRMHALSESLIQTRRAELEEGSKEFDSATGGGRDMLDILLTVKDEDGIGLSDVDIREQVDNFLFAGRDTSSNVLQFAVHHLAGHPDLQKKCRQEAVKVVEECCGVENLSHEHLAGLTFVTMFIKETLRYSTIVPNIGRSPAQDIVVDGKTLPKGSHIQLNIIGVHHNPEIWDNPEVFDPDRFSPEKAERHPYAFIPFAVGAHNCIGQRFAMDEMKVVLCMILLKFRIEPDPDAPVTYWCDTGVARPKPGVFVKLELH